MDVGLQAAVEDELDHTSTVVGRITTNGSWGMLDDAAVRRGGEQKEVGQPIGSTVAMTGRSIPPLSLAATDRKSVV